MKFSKNKQPKSGPNSKTMRRNKEEMKKK